jgi:hypothetical protein
LVAFKTLFYLVFVLYILETSAWSVPDSFQKATSSVGNQRGSNFEESLIDRQRLPSDASFYSCTSGL